MRTTLTLDDDVAVVAAQQVKLRGQSLGKAVSDLVRRGLNAPVPTEEKNGLKIFKLPPDSPVVTTEQVRGLEREGV